MIVGYTSGIFDLFHIGHLNILMNAKKNCDYLIVGVTSDEESYRLKQKYPIIEENQRKKLIESVVYVDKVIFEKNSDKIYVWEKIKFDILFKGSDWKNTEKYRQYKEYFKKIGVEIYFFDYTDNISSTIIKERIMNLN